MAKGASVVNQAQRLVQWSACTSWEAEALAPQ